MKKSGGGLNEALDAAYRLIKYRDRSAFELAERLRKKGFKDDICGNVIAELKRLGYIDDMRFAKALAEDIIRFKPGGIEFMRAKFRLKGIPAEIADSVISEISAGYSEDEAAYRLAELKAKRLAGVEPMKAKQRIYNFLARRRFKYDTITAALSRAFKNDE